MTTHVINSDTSLQSFIGEVREMYLQHRYIKATTKTGKARSIDQNSISHAWYEQLARELREDDARGHKRFCKLHFAVPILRAEDSDYREFYDLAIKNNLSYEKKLAAMDFVPATSLMTKKQKSKYLEEVQSHFLSRGVKLEFPND